MKSVLMTSLSFLVIAACSSSGERVVEKSNVAIKNPVAKREYKKTGWISNDRFRALVYVVTIDECKKTPEFQLKEKIKFEGIISLQRSLGNGFNQQRYRAITNLVNNYGKVLVEKQECVKDNVYVLDIIKENLRDEFSRIKSIR